MFQVTECILVGKSALNKGFNPVIVIPVYNHQDAVTNTLKNVLEYGYPVVLVDDGSEAECHNVLCGLVEKYRGSVYLVHLKINGGKGAAVKAGMLYAIDKGFSHVLQVDADGQHNINDIPSFILAAKHAQKSLICGCPIYDESVPKHRYYARYLTHVWIWINTLSFAIKDSMCGFRVYPLAQTCDLINTAPCGDRMDFDSEIIVRWVWANHKVKNIPTKVTYPEDGISHFNKVHDNILISWMHTRLFFGMLRRSPYIIWKKISE